MMLLPVDGGILGLAIKIKCGESRRDIRNLQKVCMVFGGV
jgi:hypothetical protein